MSNPDVERCILRAASREDYQTVMGKKPTDFSLQTAIARAHQQLSLGEWLPACPEYPTLQVVDITPATTCSVDDVSAATFIVLPPLAPAEERSEAALDGQLSRNATEGGLQSEEKTATAVPAGVRVTLDETLPEGSAALATEALLEELLLPSGAIARVGDDDVGCTFLLARTGTWFPGGDEANNDNGELALRANPTLFRNIRAAYVKSKDLRFECVLGGQQTPYVNYADSSFILARDCLQPMEDAATGEPLVSADTDNAEAQPCVRKLFLCPAVDDFTLSNALGSDYADMLAACLGAAAGKLHGRFVSEGDVISLDLSPAELASGTHNLMEGLDVSEALLKYLSHKTTEADSLWTSEDGLTPSHLLTVFRVAEVRACDRSRSDAAGSTTFSFGFIYLDGKDKHLHTEVMLVSQQRCPWVDSTPFLPPLPPPSFAVGAVAGRARCNAPAVRPQHRSLASLNMEFQRLVRSVVEAVCLPFDRKGDRESGGKRGEVLVVHGVKENFPSVFVEEAIRRVGLIPLFASAESFDDVEELRALLENFAACTEGVALVIRHAQVLAAEHREILPLIGAGASGRDGAELGASGPHLTILLCETVDPVVPTIAASATNAGGVLECGNPSEDDRKQLLEHCMAANALRLDFHTSLLLSCGALAAWTVGISFADLIEYAEECAVAATRTSHRAGVRPVLSEQMCEEVLQRYLKEHGHNLVSTKLTPVRWSDVGGLEDAKRELKETIQLPILHPEMFANGMKKRTGILFYGPPGCGKTLLAKAVATEMNMNFMSVKGPELINQYVGESERNIRLLFQRARDNSPCIVFFDELDALAPARGAKGDAGGAMDRIVSQLLVEVDGVGQTRSDGSSSGDVFIIGATNRPDLLDPSLLRPGRFDRLCYLGIPSTPDEQLFALKALTRKFDLDTDVDLQKLIAPLDYVYTGADFFALCSDAMMFSVEDALEAAKADIQRATEAGGIEDDEADGDSDPEAEERQPIKVCMHHLVRARDQLKPSVTKDDLRKYESLKAKFNK